MFNKQYKEVKFLNKVLLVRKQLNLSQDAFGEKLGLTKSGVSKIERGERGLTDTMFKLVCSTYNVNPNWLRTGEGEMFNVNEEDELAYLIGGLFAEDSPFKKRFVKTMLKLDDAQWEQVQNLVKMLSEEKED